MVGLLLLAAVAVVATAQPPNLPCVTWIPATSKEPTPDPSDLFLADYTWVITADNGAICLEEGDIFPCFASDTGIDTWGHHDYLQGTINHDFCRTWHKGAVYFSKNMYLPKKGADWQTWTWQLAQTGGEVPANAIRYGSAVMARSTANPPGYCCGVGFIGWANATEDNVFGSVHFSIVQNPVTTNSFEVAICKAYHPTPEPTPPTTSPAPETPQPTPLPNDKPYIRFGNAVPSENNVDAVITQGNVSFTWTNMAFGDFSFWVEIFQSGTGNITIYQNVNGSRGQFLMSKIIPLTPGPLVVVTKDLWPPTEPTNIETIAASYTPPHGKESGVRLFNLSPDTPSAGMSRDGETLVSNILYTLGSGWALIPVEAATFRAFDQSSNATLGVITTTPPNPPMVFTNFLIGLQNTSIQALETRLLPLIDAPES